MSQQGENQTERKDDSEDKENFEDSRATSSMSNSTFLTAERVQNEKADVSENGTLDLSNLLLTHLDKNLGVEYATVKHLIVSGNRFQKITFMKLFPSLETLNAQDCQINTFIAEFNSHLTELYLARNQLTEINKFGRFENLKILDLSSNIIDDHIVFGSFKCLAILNLSSNSLTQLPDLSKCSSLDSLNLSENKIKELTEITKLINPANLLKLDISSNAIDDLSQFSLLSAYKLLDEISISENPCILEVNDEDKFDYRSYIVACCSEQLRTIDQENIEDHVQTEGEWLSMQGGIKKIGPGNHQKLCDLIASHFPKADSGPPTPAQKSCYKALEKRRSIAAESGNPLESERGIPLDLSLQSEDTNRTVNSVYSPFREWNGKIGAMRTPGSSGRVGGLDKNLRMCSPPEARKNKSFTFQTESTPIKLLERQSHFQSTRSNSTETIICSARTEISFAVDGKLDSTPLPIIDTAPTKEQVRSVPSPSISSETSCRTPGVAETSYVADDNEELQLRVKNLELKVNELQKQNENLTAMNDGLVETLEAFKSEQTQMWNAIRSMIPTPRNMTNSFVCHTEDGHHVHQVKWEMPIVKGYRVIVDGNECGQIIGKSNSARITDLSADESHSIQIQPIGNNGEYGEVSAKLHINPSK